MHKIVNDRLASVKRCLVAMSCLTLVLLIVVSAVLVVGFGNGTTRDFEVVFKSVECSSNLDFMNTTCYLDYSFRTPVIQSRYRILKKVDTFLARFVVSLVRKNNEKFTLINTTAINMCESRNKKVMETLVFIIVDEVRRYGNFTMDCPLDPPKPFFRVDFETNTFRMNGQPFRYVSGSFHYFRALPQTWKTRLRTMRAAGLNAVDTYVEWAFHNPKDGNYTFDGAANLEQFLEYAVEEDLYVILRPGPYICAERDNGGLPFWLFRKYPQIKPRTSDPDYKAEVSKWYAELMPRIKRFLFGNGGPIIMVQVENEYGAFDACDKDYLNWLRDETKWHVGSNALLFTTDIPDERISCGKIDGVFATTDFGADRVHEMDKIWDTLRAVQPNGPLVNSEFYPGWLTHWQEKNQRRDPEVIAEALKKILESGASVNIYMFFGGTNFGYSAGANSWGYGKYIPDITSYDYDAPMDEAGDPTIKYLKLRNVINSYLTLPLIPVPDKQPKMTLDPVHLIAVDTITSPSSLQHLGRNSILLDRPATFAELDQFSGLVLYETQLPVLQVDPSLLTVNDLRDRAIVLVDSKVVGVVSRQNGIKSLPISAVAGQKLQIIVENQGRINFEIADDKKGILGDVTIQQIEGSHQALTNWISLGLSESSENFDKIIESTKNLYPVPQNGQLPNGPVLFYADLTIDRSELLDTYLDTSGWGKGVVYINGFNLGRYWPVVGPQITLYVPKELLKEGENRIVVIEYHKAPPNNTFVFTDTAKLDGIKVDKAK